MRRDSGAGLSSTIAPSRVHPTDALSRQGRATVEPRTTRLRRAGAETGRAPRLPGDLPGMAGTPSLRQVLAPVPTSLAVVCTMDGSHPVGVTIGSFVSVSLDPPLVAYFAMRSSATLRAVQRASAFSVNVLAEDQADLAEVFARRAADRFHGVRWHVGPGGSPHLDGALVVLDCELDSVTTVGDHEMVVGRTTGVAAVRPGAGPLVFALGRFHALTRGDAVGPDAVAEPPEDDGVRMPA